MTIILPLNQGEKPMPQNEVVVGAVVDVVVAAKAQDVVIVPQLTTKTGYGPLSLDMVWL
jgi:hypothetical protein